MVQRKSIVVPAIAHKFPVPNACRIGNLVMSGSISGFDPVSHEMPDDLAAQCKNMFGNMRSIIEAAGGSVDDIIKVTAFVRDRNNRGPLNDEWVRMFPNAESRPARHAQPLTIEGPFLIQCDFVAWIAQA
jgi:2-iminobutanoate/2-iminopropanoate deaminase